MIGETLEQVRLVRDDAQMVQLHLSLGPGQRLRPIERDRITMPVGQIEHVFP